MSVRPAMMGGRVVMRMSAFDDPSRVRTWSVTRRGSARIHDSIHMTSGTPGWNCHVSCLRICQTKRTMMSVMPGR